MELILLIICLVVTTLIGWSLLNIVFYKSRPLALLERLSLSYGLGMGAITLEIFFFYFLKIRLNILNLLLPWIPIAIFSIFFIRPDSLSISQQTQKLSLFEKFLFTGISFEVILAFFRALIKPLESFDSIAIYAIRSKIIYMSKGIPSNFFSEITHNFPTPDYPLLVPLSEAWVYTFLGNLNELLVKAIFPMFFLSFLIIFFFLLKRFVSRKSALLFTFLLATIPQFNHFATIGYTDFALAYYYSIGAVFLYLWMKEGNPSFLILSGIFSGFAIWTKNEGVVLCLVNFILLSLFLVNNFKKRAKQLIRHIVTFGLIIILISGPWLALKISMNLNNELFQFNTMGLGRFTDIFKKLDWIPVILYEFQKQFFGPKKWNLIWILFLAMLIINFRRSFSDDLRYLSLSIISIIFLYGAVYLLIPIEGPINWYLSTTVSRLFIHFVPVTVFWLALMCHETDIYR